MAGAERKKKKKNLPKRVNATMTREFRYWGTFLQDHRLEMNNYAKECKNNKNNVAFWFIGLVGTEQVDTLNISG